LVKRYRRYLLITTNHFNTINGFVLAL
jgi:hypothetical protein